MNTARQLGVSALTALATLTFAGAAFAQDAEATASTSGGVALPAPATATAGDSDHSAVIGRLGFGYMGFNGVPIANSMTVVEAPVVGVRYWLDDMLGIDVGIGFRTVTGSSKTGDTTTDAPSSTAFALHGGVPLSLYSAKHYSFQIVPELNLGFGTGETPQGADADPAKHSGFILDVGARAGAEVHFGFMGLPDLALQGSIGLGLAYATGSTDPGNGGTESSTSAFGISTRVGNSPWLALSQNVAAIYYF